MSSVRLYPYPRIDNAVEWSRTSVVADSQHVAPEDLADRWDADSKLVFTVSAAVPNSRIEEFGDNRPMLNLSIGCKETGEAAYATSNFSKDSALSYATASVALDGKRIAQQLELRATVTAPFGEQPWLSRRIIASRRVEKFNLESELEGFPTSAVSFKDNNLKASPWLVRVNAVSLSDPCAHVVRLMLNEDYPRVVELIEGQARPHVEAALQVSIIRTLLQTVKRLADESGEDAHVETAIAENPESIAAAAAKCCRDFLDLSLPAALSYLRRQPEHIDHLIMSSVGFLKEKQ